MKGAVSSLVLASEAATRFNHDDSRMSESERTKHNKQLMKAFENLAICLKVKQVGRTHVNGYII